MGQIRFSGDLHQAKTKFLKHLEKAFKLRKNPDARFGFG
jgi:hypothetical protein